MRYNNRGELSTWTLSGGLRVDAAGRARVITGPAVRGDLLTTAETADGQSLVLSGPPGAVREGILNEAFAPDDQRRLAPDVGEIEATRALDLDQDGTMYLLGIRRVNQQEEHVVRRCETAGWTCQDVPLVRAGRCALGERRPSAALRFAEGDSLLVVGDGRMYTRTAGGDRFYCEPSTDALRVELRSASRPLRGFVGSARLGRRVFLSGYVESSREEGPLSVILTTTVGLTTGEPPLARVLRFALVGGGEQPVGTFIPHPERSDRLLFHPQDSGQLLELDVDGRVVGQEEVSQRFPELGERPLVMSHEHGWVVARSGSGVIHRRRVAEPRFTRVFGPDLADPWFSSALVLGDELWLFHEGPVRRLSASAGAQCLQQAGPVPQISGYPSGVVAKLALPDSRGPGWAVLAVEGPTNALLFLDLRAQEVRSIQRLGTEQMLAGAELSPGRWVMIERSGRAYLVEEDGRQALEPILDDPTTPANESPVSELRWTTVSAAGGVAWLGAQGALGRVVLAAEGPRLEAYWLAQRTGGGYADFGRADGTRFQAAAALCPDDVVIASRELPVASPTGIGDRERHLLWRLGPGCGDELCEEGSHEARPEVSPSGTAVARALVAHAGGVTAVYDDGVLRREGSPRTAAPSPALDAGLAFPDLVVVLRGKHLFAARVLR